jgi:protein RecA
MSQLDKDQKLKALQLTMDRLDKTYGKGTVMRLGDKQVSYVDVISTGSIGLDVALGINGLPKGRIVEIYGPESSGKTTLAIHAIAECQKQGGIAAIYENGFITIKKGDWKMRVEKATHVPLTLNGKAKFMIANTLAATLASYLYGFKTDDIKAF